MRIIDRNAMVPYSAEQMYALVDDVESYPEFLPWCEAATLQSRTDAELVAGLKVGFGALNTTFTTRNTLQPPEQMTLELEDGPFSSLTGCWRFDALGADGCEVTLHIEFAFSSGVKDMMFGGVFETICTELIDAFVQRAHSLYGAAR